MLGHASSVHEYGCVSVCGGDVYHPGVLAFARTPGY